MAIVPEGAVGIDGNIGGGYVGQICQVEGAQKAVVDRDIEVTRFFCSVLFLMLVCALCCGGFGAAAAGLSS